MTIKPMKDQRTTMQFAKDYAAHLALVVKRQEGGHVLFKRYGDKKRIGGPYHSARTLADAVERWGDRMARGLEECR
jgi:hypothetical protein